MARIRHFHELDVYRMTCELAIEIYQSDFRRLDQAYENVIGKLVRMIDDPDKWLIRKKPDDE